MADTALPAPSHPQTRRFAARWLRGLVRGVVQHLVARWVVWRAGPRGAAPTVVFLPSRGREMSSLLRIHVVARALRPLGWRTVVVPWRLGLGRRQDILAALRPDLVVMQGARHALNRPDLYPGARIVYDMDDADFHLDHLAEQVRAAMPQVAQVIAGSRYVADWCRAQGAQAEVVWTGTPVSRRPFRPHDRRGPVVAWAQTTPATYHLERAFVLAVMRDVAARHPGVTLRLYGRRPGEPETILAPFRQAGIAVEWLPTLRYDRFLRSLQDVAVGLSPVAADNPFSRGKSFGKILAYLDRGVPVVAGDRVDHPLFFGRDIGVLSNDAGEVAAAVCRLLENPQERQDVAERAHARFLDVFAPGPVASRIDRVLREVLARPTDTRPAAPVVQGPAAPGHSGDPSRDARAETAPPARTAA
jgi:hypothetical protein